MGLYNHISADYNKFIIEIEKLSFLINLLYSANM